jgi:mannose-1-phosphate guanylyltransferase
MQDLFGPIADLRSRETDHRHVIVLAGGDGRRLAGVSQQLYGYERPKQYCRLGSSRTLVEETVWRAARFAGAADRIVVSTSRAHRGEANECLEAWPGVHRVEQPRNLDTLPGLLLPLLHVLVRDPWATVLVLPSDHHVSDDELFIDRMIDALPALVEDPDAVLLGGALMSRPDPELGWIVPGEPTGRVLRVSRFVEKPGRELVERLVRKGALANTMAMLGTGGAIARMIRRFAPDWWSSLINAFFDPAAIEAVYRTMPPCNLSKDVLTPGAAWLGVVPLHGVEWSDIGNPERLRAVRTVPVSDQAVAC